MEKDIEGLIVPLITPLKDDAVIDREGLAALVDYVVDGGVDSLFILGTTGEGPCLSSPTKYDMIVQTSRYLAGRKKYMVGITDTALEDSIKWSRLAADHGAAAVVLAPPPYFPFTQEELTSYVRYVVRQSPLPVVLYNIPRLTKTTFGKDTVERLLNEKGIIGFKDSSRDWNYFQEIVQVVKARPDWTILTGAEELLVESMEIGADGGVLGGANLFPSLLRDFYQAIKYKNEQQVNVLGGMLADCRGIYARGDGATSSIQVIKYILEQAGICQGRMTPPFQELDTSAQTEVMGIIAHHFSVKGNGIFKR